MNRELFRTATEQLGISPLSFSTDGWFPIETYVLSIESGGWAVYYSERGLRVGEVRFDTEDEACEYLLQILVADPTTRL